MLRGRRPLVLDTNVPIVANRRDGGSYTCASACAQELLALKNGGTILLDDQGLILGEYSKYLNYKGQPGAGDAFLRWLINNRGRIDLCRIVPISVSVHKWRRFDEFPEDEMLSDFDPADQKFIATARAGVQGVQVLQASDHKWLKWNEHLARHGLSVRFICEEELRKTAQKKK